MSVPKAGMTDREEAIRVGTMAHLAARLFECQTTATQTRVMPDHQGEQPRSTGPCGEEDEDAAPAMVS
jgi:hypothetical protein